MARELSDLLGARLGSALGDEAARCRSRERGKDVISVIPAGGGTSAGATGSRERLDLTGRQIAGSSFKVKFFPHITDHASLNSMNVRAT